MGVDHLLIDVKTSSGRVQVKKAPSDIALGNAVVDFQLSITTNTYAARFDVVDLEAS